MSILYKYHISLGFKIEREGKIFTCRSFISIIFPVQIETESGHKFMRVSILYKYHISPLAFKTGPKLTIVSILYKYHISRHFLSTLIGLENRCRSFISIIFPQSKNAPCPFGTSTCRSFISIIFPPTLWLETATAYTVSILYKYHISHKKTA